MNSRRLRAVSPLIILAVLSLQSCHGDDVHGPDVSKNESDEGGIFGFSFSPLSYLFGSDHGDGADEEKEIVDDVTTVKTAAQAGVEIDNADNEGDDRGVKNGMETARQAQEAAEKMTGYDISDTDRSAGDVRDLDEEPASAADKGQPSMSADQDEVKSEIERLKAAELAEFIDEKHEAQPRDWRRKLSSAAKNTGLSKQMAASAPYNISSSAVSDASSCQQSPNMDDLSRYMRTCQNCLVQWDRYQCPLHEKVLELEKWMRELQDLLSYGCRMGDNCRGTDKCCHSSDPALERALDQMTQLARDMYNVLLESCSSCPRDGGWSDWCEWGACSVSCGEGTRTRSRACNNPAPKGNGRQCQGPSMDTTPCFGPPCCTDGSWSPWSAFGPCQATCGQGMQERTRTCSNPPPSPCGRTCPGPSSDMRLCDTGRPCCIDGEWAEWSPWTPCPVTCGRGTVDRVRTCSNPAPSDCGRSCPGPSRDTRVCDLDDCCVHGNWGLWSMWSACPVSCGLGQRERRRLCNSPPPNDCGQTCLGESTERVQQPCGPDQEDGNWGLWGAWSACTVTCGMGQVERRRRCDSPPPNDCGRSCPGPAIERDLHPCGLDPGDGNWGAWEPWGTCSVTCGIGQQLRRRRCDNPAANLCGLPCLGFDSDSRSCDAGPCCADRQWSLWSPWSTCSATCGAGTRTRERFCESVGFGQDCGITCQGSGFETTGCAGLPCDPPWNPWSPCSATCEGQGTRQRRRQYVEGIGVNSVETEQCRVFSPPCHEWGAWESWCPCDCRTGITSRRRNCMERTPRGEVVTVDVQQCAPGESREENYCDVRRVCPVCVINCNNRKDGNYYSCTSCRDYVNCKNGQMSILSCTVQHYEWDAFIAKCRQGGSPSCSLQPCVTSCTGRDDGPVHGCSGCSTYLQCRGGRDTEYLCPAGQEFNAHSRRCEVEMSPTCTRTLDVMMGDAPADSYFDMEDEDAEERYQQLVKQTGVAAILHRDNHTGTLFKSQADGDKRDDKVDYYIKIIGDGRDKEKAKPSPRMSKKDKKEVTCQTDCAGLAPGLYQSCLGCDQYLVCTRHGATRIGRCPRNKRWDDKRKKCRKNSLTCNSTPGSKPNPGLS